MHKLSRNRTIPFCRNNRYDLICCAKLARHHRKAFARMCFLCYSESPPPDGCSSGVGTDIRLMPSASPGSFRNQKTHCARYPNTSGCTYEITMDTDIEAGACRKLNERREAMLGRSVSRSLVGRWSLLWIAQPAASVVSSCVPDVSRMLVMVVGWVPLKVLLSKLSFPERWPPPHAVPWPAPHMRRRRPPLSDAGPAACPSRAG